MVLEHRGQSNHLRQQAFMDQIIARPSGQKSSSTHVPQGHAKGATAPLGKYAKSSPPPSLPQDDRAKLRATRAERYRLLSGARAIFLWAGRQAGLEHPGNFHRTAKCRYVPHGQVGVWRSQAHAGAFYSGLTTCGSVWACPVCTAVVQERRREEIAQAIDWAYAQGLQPVMVTLTFPHRSWHRLGDLLAQQADALTRLRKGRAWDKLKRRWGYRGLIRALELTHGEHGWHPHTHELWLVDKDTDAEQMRAEILERWQSACARAGLLDLADADQVRAFEAHAVDVKGNCSASDYLAKQDEARHWGADRELAKASTKAGRAKGRHPFAILADATDGDPQAIALWLDYAEAIHGKAQLFWSRGLKALVGVADRTDEELAEESRDAADVLGMLDAQQWRAIRRADKRAEVLDAAEASGWPGVLAVLAGIGPPTIPAAYDNIHDG